MGVSAGAALEILRRMQSESAASQNATSHAGALTDSTIGTGTGFGRMGQAGVSSSVAANVFTYTPAVSNGTLKRTII